MNPSTPTGVVVVYVTAPMAEAPGLARALVERQLAACVNVVPGVQSVYRWEDEVQSEEEALLVIKTRSEAFDSLVRGVRELHSHSVPEVIAVPVVAGSEPYIDWVRDSVSERLGA